MFIDYDDYAILKAEVERLEKEVWRMKVFKGIDEDTKATMKDALNTVPEWAKVLETIENNARLETENIALKAEIERLKAEVIKHIEEASNARLKVAEVVKDSMGLKAEVKRLRDGVETMTYHASGVETTAWVRAVEYDRLKAKVERLTADLNKMTKTPEGVDYVEVDVGFWTKSGSRLPSSYSTFWSNDKGVQS
jgi:uncharacterized small protein (DUF1192 family)